MTNETKVVGIVALIMVVAIGLVSYFAVKSSSDTAMVTQVVTASSDVKDAGQLSRSDAYTEGDKDAKVKIVEFGDYQCPACGAAHPMVSQLLKDYAGKGVSLEFRNFPLPQHQNAQLAATAAEAAGVQGKYWEMHDALYVNQQEWTADPPTSKTVQGATDLLKGYAKNLGLDINKFDTSLDGRSFNTKISRDLADAEALKLHGTPSFFVNGKQVNSVNELKTAVDAELSK